MSTTALKPRAFRLLDTCTKTCTLNSYTLGPKMAELVHSWYESGCNNATIHERAKNIGQSISEGAAGRHRANHLEPLGELDDPTQGDAPKIDDVELLDQVIARGAESLRFKTSRVTPEQMLKAMDLKYKLTQGNVFEGFLAAMGETMGEITSESEPATRSEDEAAQAAGDHE